MNKHIANPPFKRVRVGRQLKAQLTRAINATATSTSKRSPDLGTLFKALRNDLGKTPRYKLAEMLDMTEQTLLKLETSPLRSGIQPTLKLLNAFGLTIAIEHESVDQTMGFLPLDKAFAAVRNRNAHLTQRDLSQASGVARTTIQNIETGKAVKVATLTLLLSAMDGRLAIVSLDEMTTADEIELKDEARKEPENDKPQDDDHAQVIDSRAPTLAQMLTREPGFKLG